MKVEWRPLFGDEARALQRTGHASAGFQGEPVVRELEDQKIPRFLFLNKIDKADAGVYDALNLLQPASRCKLLLRQIPTFSGDIITGFVDLALERAFVYKEHAPSQVIPLEGEALDVGALYRTPAGKPRVSIFSIAHLSDAERMFFVALLLNEILGWVRMQSGTTSLRAILYMDEIFGFFPPVAEPPAKRPLLTLLKQARAFGLGVVLATQNPVDLDYKGLANTGTWLLGRLQTERDKQRVLEGLEGAAAAQSASFDRKSMEELLAGLGNRVFLMNDVHEDGPVVLETRWAMSYLRGPLTRDQIKVLMKGHRPQGAAAPAAQTDRAARADEDQQSREERDAAIDALRKEYAPKVHRAEEKARRAAQIVEREEGQLRGAGLQTAVSAGATILTAIFGRKKVSYSTIDRGTTTARGAARAMEQREDVKRAKENLAQAEQELEELKAKVEEEVARIRAA